MELGSFSVSLAVKDIAVSKAFYARLGFAEMGGDESQGWLILKNGDHIIGLFQGMFENNILTFNPGWAQDASHLESFTDVREIAATLRGDGVELTGDTTGKTEAGPASFMVTDPDGNTILVDQHR
ncbi:MAG: VOC family protein [Deltaproteobacteria bacterium]|nr:VOC family protein [Deltaproteobacteria bacterium]